MRTKTIKLYNFQELPEGRAKNKALQYIGEMASDYYEFTYEDDKALLIEFLECLGMDNIKFYYSGFSSQGDGACFVGNFNYAWIDWAKAKERAYIPFFEPYIDRIKNEIGDYTINFKICSDSNYCHDKTMLVKDIEIFDINDNILEELEQPAINILLIFRELAKEFYKHLEKIYYKIHDEDYYINNFSNVLFDEKGNFQEYDSE